MHLYIHSFELELPAHVVELPPCGRAARLSQKTRAVQLSLASTTTTLDLARFALAELSTKTSITRATPKIDGTKQTSIFHSFRLLVTLGLMIKKNWTDSNKNVR